MVCSETQTVQWCGYRPASRNCVGLGHVQFHSGITFISQRNKGASCPRGLQSQRPPVSFSQQDQLYILPDKKERRCSYKWWLFNVQSLEWEICSNQHCCWESHTKLDYNRCFFWVLVAEHSQLLYLKFQLGCQRISGAANPVDWLADPFSYTQTHNARLTYKKMVFASFATIYTNFPASWRPG